MQTHGGIHTDERTCAAERGDKFTNHCCSIRLFYWLYPWLTDVWEAANEPDVALSSQRCRRGGWGTNHVGAPPAFLRTLPYPFFTIPSQVHCVCWLPSMAGILSPFHSPLWILEWNAPIKATRRTNLAKKQFTGAQSSKCQKKKWCQSLEQCLDCPFQKVCTCPAHGRASGEVT